VKGLLALYLSLFLAVLAGCGPQAGNEELPSSSEEEETSGTQEDPAAARVVCDGGGVHVLTPEVAARPDGVHLAIDNRLEGSADLSVSHAEGGMGWSVPSGESERVANVPPGKVEIDCFSRSWGRDKLFAMGTETIRVLAGDSGYRSPKLDCPRGKLAGSMGSRIGESEMGAREGSPTDLLRRELSDSLREGDVVEIAGNTRNRDEKTVRVVRDGEVVANAHYFRTSDGWLGGLTENCAGL
jgi:hypothetical protein